MVPALRTPRARLAWAVVAHALVFWGVVAVLAPATAGTAAWRVLYLVGVVVLVLGPRARFLRLSARAWARVALYSVFLAALFWGADGALNELRGAIHPRAALPAYLGGLELYLILVPGVVSVALAAALAAFASQGIRAMTPDPRASQEYEERGDPR